MTRYHFTLKSRNVKTGPIPTTMTSADTCPATYRDDVTCATCGLCASTTRKVIVGFPAHGAAKRAAAAIASQA